MLKLLLVMGELFGVERSFAGRQTQRGRVRRRAAGELMVKQLHIPEERRVRGKAGRAVVVEVVVVVEVREEAGDASDSALVTLLTPASPFKVRTS